ncbi:LLM class flavin-dependent oxidoreductase [Streptomyces sp. NPDC049881]|uniref:LLM class flavin-dependent oxidoreductase n=1 Tax=Streptomyces sp. NPDC049881 TaxID=3155778 RepID=UPI00341A6ED5
MRFAVPIPQHTTEGAFDTGRAAAFLRRAEELGFHSAWVQETGIGPVPTLGPAETLAFAAAHTRRMRLGAAVFIGPHHLPVQLAKSVASLDVLSGGRMETGIALGPKNHLAAFGASPEGLVARFTEGIRLMKACWTQDRVTFDGRFWRLADAAIGPRPLQRPHPPLWMGGHHPAALRRAVRYGDGFFGAGGASTAEFAAHVRTVRAELDAAGRDPATFSVAKRVYVHIDENAGRARAAVAGPLEKLYGRTDTAVCGPVSACVEGLRQVADAGAELILLHPVADEEGQLERLAAEVVPLL